VVAVGLGLLGVLLVVAAVYDVRHARRGESRRRTADVLSEAMHHRLDINAVPYEPAREAGQRDWATYRRRDRKR
jgi:hypothetical protein